MYISLPRSSRQGSHYILAESSVSHFLFSLSFDPSARHSRLEPLSTTLLPRSLALSPSPYYCVLSLSPSSSLLFPCCEP